MEEDKYVGGTWQNPELAIPRVVSAMVCRRSSPRGISRSSTPLWLLSFTYTGYGLSRTGSPSSPWTRRPPGSVHLYPPGTDFWEDTRGERGMLHSAWMHFSDAEECGLRGILSPQSNTLAFVDPSAAIGDLLTEAARAVQVSADHGFWCAQSVLLRLIDMLLTRVPDTEATVAHGPGAAPGRVSDLVRKVDAYLAEHAAGRVSVHDLARHAGVSSSTLSHRYRAETGTTPLAAHRQFRIGHARALLLRRQSLKEIAAATGFTDAFHLSKAFKRVTGLAPRDFVRRAQRGAEAG
jgi:AraC-like DNA-binding protein